MKAGISIGRKNDNKGKGYAMIAGAKAKHPQSQTVSFFLILKKSLDQ